MDADDASVAADVSELIVVGTREDLAAKAAHESEARAQLMRRVFRPGSRRE